MKTSDFAELVKELELDSGDKLIQPFGNSKKFECPWLRWRIRKWPDDKCPDFNPKGILLMQDWGNSEQRLEDAMDEIDQAFAERSDDTTLRNLLNDRWKAAIKSGDWIVSNAVWGLRAKQEDKEAPKCGYLGAKLHKRAFQTWGPLVVRLCEQVNDDSFTLVVAGEWASFSDFPGRDGKEDLAKYLNRWRTWATKGCKSEAEKLPPELNKEALDRCKGNAIYVPHPATWRCKGLDWTEGPQINATGL